VSIVALLVIVAAVGAVAIVLAGRTGGQAEFEPDRPPFVLPEGALSPADIDGVRFAVGARGYRMDQVDDVMDRLAAELADRDAQIARLRSGDTVRDGATWPVDDDVVLEPAGAEAPPADTDDAPDAPGSVDRA
jgi:DivIVA domain-containing protein